MNYIPFLLVFFGSGLGGVFRYGISFLQNKWSPFADQGFLSTFLVNIIGSFLIGLFSAWFLKHTVSNKAYFFIITGFLGGFTTYSSFSLDTLALMQNGDTKTALLYVASTLILGMLAVAFGFFLGRM